MVQLIPSPIFYLLVLVLCLAKPAAGRVFVGAFQRKEHPREQIQDETPARRPFPQR